MVTQNPVKQVQLSLNSCCIYELNLNSLKSKSLIFRKCSYNKFKYYAFSVNKTIPLIKSTLNL